MNIQKVVISNVDLKTALLKETLKIHNDIMKHICIIVIVNLSFAYMWLPVCF